MVSLLRKMKRILILISLLTLGLLIVIRPANKSYRMKKIDLFLKDQVDQGRTPSIQYAFFDTGRVIFESHYGWRDLISRKAVDASTTYHLFSITKTFTALAVLQLAQSGKIGLDKPVSTYLPVFPYPEDITIEQLLSHTAGIPNPLPLKWIHLAEEHPSFRRDPFFAEVFKAHPKTDFEPGTKFKYSNLGYVLLGQLVEAVSGQPFEEYVNQNILARCGPGLSFELDPSSHAVGYHKWWTFTNAIFGFLIDRSKYMGRKVGKWVPFKPFYNNGTAYGGLFGSASGLIRYAQNLLDPHSVLLNNDYKEILFSEKVVRNKTTGMSLSWFTGKLKGHEYLAHAGGGGGYYCELRIYPRLGVGSVILYNRSGMRDERILDRADAFFITEKPRQE